MLPLQIKLVYTSQGGGSGENRAVQGEAFFANTNGNTTSGGIGYGYLRNSVFRGMNIAINSSDALDIVSSGFGMIPQH